VPLVYRSLEKLCLCRKDLLGTHMAMNSSQFWGQDYGIHTTLNNRNKFIDLCKTSIKKGFPSGKDWWLSRPVPYGGWQRLPRNNVNYE